jgi:two-component system, chemotaxis family, sensor kinase Cph1
MIASKNDAEFCGRVPLHQTNLLQPHGILLVLDREFRVIQCGENVSDLLGAAAREVVGQLLSQFLIPGELEKLAMPLLQNSSSVPVLLSFHGGQRLSIVKHDPSCYIIEVENKVHSANEENAFIHIYEHLKRAMAAIEATATTQDACRVAIEELKRISGFDKVMVYQFDENWNGDVIAEVMEDGMDVYFGLKFPASDIPKQARELYRRTPYRLIPNTDYEPVRLYPVLNPLTSGFTDLSHSNLRSVAQVHLEYLANMKVKASMSTRILLNNELWGLIACHHRTPRYPGFEICAVFELMSNVISARIAAMHDKEQYHFRSEQQNQQNILRETAYREQSLMKAFLTHKMQLLHVLSAGGVVIALDGELQTVGIVPDPVQVEDLLVWVQSRVTGELYHTERLSVVYEAGAAFTETGSGLLAVPIQPDRGNFVLAFRPEVIQTVRWGGNPHDAVQFEPDGVKYHPRNSFGQWQQTVRDSARPWTAGELEMAAHFRNFMVEFTRSKT